MPDSSAGSPQQPPDPDQFELSVFGPGYGEALVVHLGGGSWMLVDSCTDSTGTPATLAYLEGLGVPHSAVKLIVASHWHDDHVRGLAVLVETYDDARFVCSSALSRGEFLKLVATMNTEALMQETSGVRELGSVLETMIRRRNDGCPRTPGLASANQVLYRESTPVAAVVTALSPSDAAVLKALTAFAALLPKPLTPKRRVASPESNDASVALWLEVGQVRVLLGADLEVTDRADMGWVAVLDDPRRPQGLAGAIKVPHHGSVTGHHDRVWEEMLVAKPHAATTMWSKGAKHLPTAADKRRLASLTEAAFVAGASNPKAARTTTAVDRTIGEVTRSFREAQGRMGHVRLRCSTSDASSEWHVDCFGPSERLAAA